VATDGRPSCHDAGWDAGQLRMKLAAMAKEVRGDRLAVNSRQTYDSATLQYAKFAVALGYKAFPASDEVLSQWLVFQAQTCKPSSLKTYLHGVRSFHLSNELEFPPIKERFAVTSTLQGLKRRYGSHAGKKMAVTRQMLIEMRQALPEYAAANKLTPSLATAVWAATVTAFFGMLRKDNVTVQKRNAFNPSVNLCRGDFRWGAEGGTASGRPDAGSAMWISVRHSKTNQTFERSHRFPLLPTGALVCPVRAVAEHFASVEGGQEDPAFSYYTRGRRRAAVPLTHGVFVRHLKGLLGAIGRTPERFSGHSLRRGGATLAFRLGLPMEQVMQHGDWRSLAVLEYNETSCADRQLVPLVMARAFASRPA
jgi:hypothetical protein